MVTSGTLTISGSSAATELPDTMTGAGNHLYIISGTSAMTEAGDTITATGFFGTTLKFGEVQIKSVYYGSVRVKQVAINGNRIQS